MPKAVCVLAGDVKGTIFFNQAVSTSCTIQIDLPPVSLFAACHNYRFNYWSPALDIHIDDLRKRLLNTFNCF